MNMQFISINTSSASALVFIYMEREREENEDEDGPTGFAMHPMHIIFLVHHIRGSGSR
jgi:hypothetical protein